MASFGEDNPNDRDPAIGAIASTQAQNSRQACCMFKQTRLKLNQRRWSAGHQEVKSINQCNIPVMM